MKILKWFAKVFIGHCVYGRSICRSHFRGFKTPSKYLRNIDGEAWVEKENFYPGK